MSLRHACMQESDNSALGDADAPFQCEPGIVPLQERLSSLEWGDTFWVVIEHLVCSGEGCFLVPQALMAQRTDHASALTRH
jgi:hypothetical protein